FEIEIANNGRALVETVQDAASEAVTRILCGETSLAFDPRCGTSLLVAIALVSLVVTGAAVVGFWNGIPLGILGASTAIAAIVVWCGSRPLGLLAQRLLTVSTRFADARVQRIVHAVDPSGSTATFLVYIDVQLTTATAAAPSLSASTT